MTPPGLTLEQRYWMKVDKTETCWLWTGTLTKAGYGTITCRPEPYKPVAFYAHRLAWEWANGRPIPDELVIDHLCRVRNCVNPAHLEPVTRAENNRRGEVRERCIAEKRGRTHCPQRHEYTPENTRVDARGCRHRKECHRQRQRAKRLLNA